MENSIFNKCELFNEINEKDIPLLLKCLKAEIKTYKKDEIILLEGNRPEFVGTVLSGIIHIVKEDYDGNHVLISAVSFGEIFAEALCCASISESPVTVTAETDSEVLILRFDRILSICSESCIFHKRLIQNMLYLVARKNIMLQKRLDIISVKSIRERVLRYLHTFPQNWGEKIDIPFNREELADYLCVDRSALSHELSKMKRENVIDYQKNSFTLLAPE